MDKVADLFAPAIALLQELGGTIFVPMIILCLALGVLLKDKLGPVRKIVLLILSIVLFYGWSSLFVVKYEDSPTTSVHKVVGWQYLPSTEEYLKRSPELSYLDRQARNAMLLLQFKGDPQLVWAGGGLTMARVVGGIIMGLVLVCLGLLVPSKSEK